MRSGGEGGGLPPRTIYEIGAREEGGSRRGEGERGEDDQEEG